MIVRNGMLAIFAVTGLLCYSTANAMQCTEIPSWMLEWFCESNLNSPTYDEWLWFEFAPRYHVTTPENLTNANIACAWGWDGNITPTVRATRASDDEYVWGELTLSCYDNGQL